MLERAGNPLLCIHDPVPGSFVQILLLKLQLGNQKLSKIFLRSTAEILQQFPALEEVWKKIKADKDDEDEAELQLKNCAFRH